jgi:hypothetical protein
MALFSNSTKTPSQVFTPRSAEVNTDMYIHRSLHEKRLLRWIEGTMHGFIFGESGNGKTWLYKNLFTEHRVNYKVANCTLAENKGSIRNEIYAACMPANTSTKTSYIEKKEGGLSLGVANSTITHEGSYTILQEDSLLTAFRHLSKESKGWGDSVIILDNVETIFSNGRLMDELADIIILLDDERYSKYKVKFLLVGVPCGVIEYFSKSKNRSSVGNRITELPALSGFTLKETIEIVKKGFNTFLSCNYSEAIITGLAGRIHDITLGVPQRVHEYCLNLCYELEDNNWILNKLVWQATDALWLIEGLRESYAAIEQHYSTNSQTRRKQVLYTIGQFKGHQFTTSEIGFLLRKHFPSSTISSDSGVGTILSSLTKGDSPILTTNKINDSYCFCDPRHIMCLRLILDKDINELITRRAFIRN